MSEIVPVNTETLIKHSLASQLRAEIISGALQPGVRIVEGTWARRFGVAQGSIREAINILAQEGFVTKDSGRSARVVNLSEEDILHLYAIRGALEGLAARTAAFSRADVSQLQLMLDAMCAAAKNGRYEVVLDRTLEFHLELCRLSGNPFLIAHAKRVLLPFFAFVRIRVMADQREAEEWRRNIGSHQKIIDLILEGDGDVAEFYVRRAMTRYATTASDAWDKSTDEAG